MYVEKQNETVKNVNDITYKNENIKEKNNLKNLTRLNFCIICMKISNKICSK